MVTFSVGRQIFSIKSAFGFETDVPVEGRLAVPGDGTPEGLVTAVESMGETASQAGVVGILPTEFDFSSTGEKILNSLVGRVSLNGILTFGACSGSYFMGRTHLDVWARDMEVPLCLAARPRLLRWEHLEGIWSRYNILKQAHGKLGRLTILGADQKHAKVEVTRSQAISLRPQG